MNNNEPLRVIEGESAPYTPFWTIRDSADGDAIEVEFDGPISEYSWRGDEITPELFKKELYEKGQGRPVNVVINSPGGEVIAASVIRSILQEYPGRVTADIVGIAASAATIVVTGADYVRMRESALFMIHDPSALAYGTIDEIKQVLKILETVKDSIVDVYETRTGMDREQLERMMSRETWMTAREAYQLGFVDEVVTGSIRKAPQNSLRAGFINCLKNYQLPEAFCAEEGEEVMNGEEEEKMLEAAAEPCMKEAPEEEERTKVEAIETDAVYRQEVERLRAYVQIFG